MKSVISGNEVVELGHILDDTYWYDGYATEAARKCPRYAFEKLGLQKVYCGIRPENTSSTRVAEATVIKPCDSYTVIYDGKEMPYLLYKTEKLM